MTGLTSYHIKLIAALTMLVDHIGFIFYPEVDALRTIGRFSLPLFVWLLVQGEAHTKNVWRYGVRLGALALVSQPFYQAAFGLSQLNVLVQLLLGLICLRALRQRLVLAVPLVAITIVATGLLPLGYGLYGMGLVLLTRCFRPRLWWWACWVSYHVCLAFFGFSGQLPVIFVPIFFTAFNGRRGPAARWFYVFYPGHLLLLALLSQ